MTEHDPQTAARSGERGMALMGVLLLMMMMSALAAALSVSSQTETLIARNQVSADQAHAAAEAGLSHAIEVTSQYLFGWQSYGLASVGVAVDIALTSAYAGNLNGMATNTPLSIAAGIDAEYSVTVVDDDATASGENGNPLDDANNVIVIRSTGTSRDGTKVVLEAQIAPMVYPAVMTNGDLTLGGNAAILGSYGSVHSNGNLSLGNSVDIAADASAQGTVTCVGDSSCASQVSGSVTAGAAQVTVPPVNAIDHLSSADYILTSIGTMTNPSGGVLCLATAKTSCNGWDFNLATGTWTLNSSSPPSGTYYVQAHANISGSPGTTSDPAEITVIATGNIELTGSPHLAPDTPGLLFVTDQDLSVQGSGSSSSVEGQMLVKGQFSISGNTAIDGQIMSENQNVSSLVTSNSISGSATVTYNGGLSVGSFIVRSYRDVRDAD